MRVAAAAEMLAHQPRRAGQAVAVKAQEMRQLMRLMARLTQAVAAVEADQVLRRAQAAPALSSFPTLWRPALRSPLSPQQRGLHRLAQRRWITLS